MFKVAANDTIKKMRKQSIEWERKKYWQNISDTNLYPEYISNPYNSAVTRQLTQECPGFQWRELSASAAGIGSVSGQGMKTWQAAQCGQKKRRLTEFKMAKNLNKYFSKENIEMTSKHMST